MLQQKIDLPIGVLRSENCIVKEGFTFYVPLKKFSYTSESEITLTQFRVTKVLYAGCDNANMERVQVSAVDNNGEKRGFIFTQNHHPEQQYITMVCVGDVKLYDSVDDFIDNKPIKFYYEKRNVSIIAPYNSVYFYACDLGCITSKALFYRITNEGIKSDFTRLAEFELRSDRNGNLWGKFTNAFRENMYLSKNAAKQALREQLKVKSLETKSNPAPQISITINICQTDTNEDILNKIKASFAYM